MSGILNAYSGGTYSGLPGAPTIGTATATGSTTASVAFTAPTNTGGLSITGYQVLSSPGSITATGSSSPITVTGLTASTSYTFQVRAQNSLGYGAYSGSSNSITTSVAPNSQSYTTAGSYSWVAPANVTSVSVVAVGAGQAGYQTTAGKGGALSYLNNYTVTPGSSYTVVVSASLFTATSSYFVNTSVLNAGQGSVRAGTGGGDGGAAGCRQGGGGAGGYAGNGGAGAVTWTVASGNGSGGGGGGGSSQYSNAGGSGGGGVGILGQGTSGNGAPASSGYYYLNGGGGGSGGGSGGYSYGSPCAAVGADGGSGNGTGGGAGGAGCGPGYNSGGGGGGGFGGGGGGSYAIAGTGGNGAVRIIWPGSTRSFPSTCAGSP